MALISEFISAFLLGLATPLTAVCVLPLYPGFLAYIANQFSGTIDGATKKHYALFGTLVTLGVVLFMLIFGLLFTTFLQKSLTSAINVVSPIAFGILGIISLLLIFNIDFTSIIPRAKTPTAKNPIINAILYGFFFGAIVLPCNPGFIAAFLARAALVSNFASSILNFIFFGLGMGFPLLAFSLLSSKWSRNIISFTTTHKKGINRSAGVIMLGISIYYLFFVFKVIG